LWGYEVLTNQAQRKRLIDCGKKEGSWGAFCEIWTPDATLEPDVDLFERAQRLKEYLNVQAS